MEQPASRHSNPASRKTRSIPSASARARTSVEPGTQIALTPGATLRPRNSAAARRRRSEEHTSELQSLMRISYAVFCLKKKKTNIHNTHMITHPRTRDIKHTQYN